MTTVLELEKRFLSVGTVARLVGCSASTLRELESRGLLPFTPARLAGSEYRLYTVADVEAIKAVREAQHRERQEAA